MTRQTSSPCGDTGTEVPSAQEFHPEILDYVSGIVAICMLFIAILPVRDIFILLH